MRDVPDSNKDGLFLVYTTAVRRTPMHVAAGLGKTVTLASLLTSSPGDIEIKEDKHGKDAMLVRASQQSRAGGSELAVRC